MKKKPRGENLVTLSLKHVTLLQRILLKKFYPPFFEPKTCLMYLIIILFCFSYLGSFWRDYQLETRVTALQAGHLIPHPCGRISTHTAYDHTGTLTLR
jgi:hypothetical protein